MEAGLGVPRVTSSWCCSLQQVAPLLGLHSPSLCPDFDPGESMTGPCPLGAAGLASLPLGQGPLDPASGLVANSRLQERGNLHSLPLLTFHSGGCPRETLAGAQEPWRC